MKYKGKIYGKIAGKYVELEDDWDIEDEEINRIALKYMTNYSNYEWELHGIDENDVLEFVREILAVAHD